MLKHVVVKVKQYTVKLCGYNINTDQDYFHQQMHSFIKHIKC